MFVGTISNYRVIKVNPPQLLPYNLKDTSGVIYMVIRFIWLAKKGRIKMLTKWRRWARPKNYNAGSVPQAFVIVSGVLLFPVIVFLLLEMYTFVDVFCLIVHVSVDCLLYCTTCLWSKALNRYPKFDIIRWKWLSIIIR